MSEGASRPQRPSEREILSIRSWSAFGIDKPCPAASRCSTPASSGISSSSTKRCTSSFNMRCSSASSKSMVFSPLLLRFVLLDGLAAQQSVDFIVLQSRFAQNLATMFADAGRGPSNRGRRARELRRRADIAHRPLARMLHRLEETGGNELRMLRQFVEAVERRRRNIELIADAHPFGGRARQRDHVQGGVDL